MPTVLRVGPYRFHFFSNEGLEPPHIHIKAADCAAKVWLDPIALASNYGFCTHELKEIVEIVEQHQGEWLGFWHEYFGRK